MIELRTYLRTPDGKEGWVLEEDALEQALNLFNKGATDVSLVVAMYPPGEEVVISLDLLWSAVCVMKDLQQTIDDRLCQKEGEDGLSCDREKNHEGRHAFHGSSVQPLVEW